MNTLRMLILLFFVIISASNSLRDANHNINKKWVWSICSNSSCTCGATLGKAIECVQEDTLIIQPCYCLFYDRKCGTTVAGICFYSCFYPNYQNYKTRNIYFTINRYSLQHYSQFNEDMCSYISLNRTGKFCGQCDKGLGFPVYSYDMTCIECEGRSLKIWCKYFAIAFGPLTVFYIVMVILRVSMPPSRLNGLLFIGQCFTSPMQLRVYYLWTQTIPLKDMNPLLSDSLNIFFSTLGLANLDFFRELYPTFCLDPHYNILQVMSLDLLVALYPFFLILCTYYLITLYDKNCCFLVSVWKIIMKVLSPVLKKSVHVSLIETFATFILFSSVKIIGLSYDLLNYTKLYREDGSKEGLYVFYDPSIPYFGKKHLPYACMAIVSAFFFGFLPFLLLLLYPMRVFHRLLNCCNVRSQALHVFMDAFQGSYKIKPYDTRYFSAWYLLLRFLFLLFMGYFTSVLTFLAASLLMTVGALSVVIVRPYKNSCSNTQDIVLLWSAALIYLLAGADIAASLVDYTHLHTVQAAVAISAVFIVLTLLISLFWYPVSRLVHKLYAAYRLKFRRQRLLTAMD